MTDGSRVYVNQELSLSLPGRHLWNFCCKGVYEMKDILRPILELSVVLPGLLLAYFPVKSYLKQSPENLPPGFSTDGRIVYRCWIICYQLHASTASALAGITLQLGYIWNTPNLL